ncbi:MAG: hypothetical protein RL404_2935 [Pseudomonadota bacterium]|jgi:hypothetical protein
MEKLRTFSGRIDQAFSSLLMAKDIIEKIIPDSDDEQARAHAAKFVAELIKTAVSHLIPTPVEEAEVHEFPASASPTFSAAEGLVGGNMIDTMDIDAQIERHLRHKHSVRIGTLPVWSE